MVLFPALFAATARPYARRMPSEPAVEPGAATRRAHLRTSLAPAGGIGVICGLVALQEGAAWPIALVVGFVLPLAALGMIALKRALASG